MSRHKKNDEPADGTTTEPVRAFPPKDHDEPVEKDKPAPAEIPRASDGEVDVKAWKASKREKPGEEPKLPAQRAGTKLAVVHGSPHVGQAMHVAGEDTPEVPSDEFPEGEEKPVIPEADNVAKLHALRKEGRLYRCAIRGLETKLIEADSPEQAKQAYCEDIRKERGEGEMVKNSREYSVPLGTQPEPPSVKPHLVRCVQLKP